MRFLTSAVAQQLDKDLMSPEGGFCVEQLMELAGLSCAEAVFRSYPPHNYRRVLVACGPGNQGGDGLVAARHLKQFGYTPSVWYPKHKSAPLFDGLVRQLHNLQVEFVQPDDFATALQERTDAVLDSIFGFSFQGEPREPFRSALEAIVRARSEGVGADHKRLPVVSVDIPSSWNVDAGPSTSELARAFQPDVLVSLTAPKMGVREFKGSRHFLGGRFIDAATDKKYELNLPAYPDVSQIVDITGAVPSESSSKA